MTRSYRPVPVVQAESKARNVRKRRGFTRRSLAVGTELHHRGRLYSTVLVVLIPKRFIREAKVVGFKPNSAAAPPVP